MEYDRLLAACAAGLLGALVGVVELVTRYRDAPGAALRTSPALFYVTINALGSVLAWFLIEVYEIVAKAGEMGLSQHVQAVGLAGLGAAAFFRTSLFTLRAGNADISVGPNILIDTLLQATDRSVDRRMAEVRARIVAQIMDGIDFEKAKSSLPTTCFALMQNLGAEEAAQISRGIDALDGRKDLDTRSKALVLGLLLLNAVGTEVLSTAVSTLGETIRQ